MSIRRVDQDMAAQAAGMLPRPVTKELRTRYRQLRVMLHTAGLAATYAFIVARASTDTGSRDLAQAYSQVAHGIRDRLTLAPADARTSDPQQVLRHLGEMESADYARASAETAALLGWLSRLADACAPQDQRPADADGQAHAGSQAG
jgi:CRISPR/Cas system CMR-associated protein Cmr5 small subunit